MHHQTMLEAETIQRARQQTGAEPGAAVDKVGTQCAANTTTRAPADPTARGDSFGTMPMNLLANHPLDGPGITDPEPIPESARATAEAYFKNQAADPSVGRLISSAVNAGREAADRLYNAHEQHSFGSKKAPAATTTDTGGSRSTAMSRAPVQSALLSLPKHTKSTLANSMHGVPPGHPYTQHHHSHHTPTTTPTWTSHTPSQIPPSNIYNSATILRNKFEGDTMRIKAPHVSGKSNPPHGSGIKGMFGHASKPSTRLQLPYERSSSCQAKGVKLQLLSPYLPPPAASAFDTLAAFRTQSGLYPPHPHSHSHAHPAGNGGMAHAAVGHSPYGSAMGMHLHAHLPSWVGPHVTKGAGAGQAQENRANETGVVGSPYGSGRSVWGNMLSDGTNPNSAGNGNAQRSARRKEKDDEAEKLQVPGKAVKIAPCKCKYKSEDTLKCDLCETQSSVCCLLLQKMPQTKFWFCTDCRTTLEEKAPSRLVRGRYGSAQAPAYRLKPQRGRPNKPVRLERVAGDLPVLHRITHGLSDGEMSLVKMAVAVAGNNNNSTPAPTYVPGFMQRQASDDVNASAEKKMSTDGKVAATGAHLLLHGAPARGTAAADSGGVPADSRILADSTTRADNPNPAVGKILAGDTAPGGTRSTAGSILPADGKAAEVPPKHPTSRPIPPSAFSTDHVRIFANSLAEKAKQIPSSLPGPVPYEVKLFESIKLATYFLQCQSCTLLKLRKAGVPIESKRDGTFWTIYTDETDTPGRSQASCRPKYITYQPTAPPRPQPHLHPADYQQVHRDGSTPLQTNTKIMPHLDTTATTSPLSPLPQQGKAPPAKTKALTRMHSANPACTTMGKPLHLAPTQGNVLEMNRGMNGVHRSTSHASVPTSSSRLAPNARLNAHGTKTGSAEPWQRNHAPAKLPQIHDSWLMRAEVTDRILELYKFDSSLNTYIRRDEAPHNSSRAMRKPSGMSEGIFAEAHHFNQQPMKSAPRREYVEVDGDSSGSASSEASSTQAYTSVSARLAAKSQNGYVLERAVANKTRPIISQHRAHISASPIDHVLESLQKAAEKSKQSQQQKRLQRLQAAAERKVDTVKSQAAAKNESQQNTRRSPSSAPTTARTDILATDAGEKVKNKHINGRKRGPRGPYKKRVKKALTDPGANGVSKKPNHTDAKATAKPLAPGKRRIGRPTKGTGNAAPAMRPPPKAHVTRIRSGALNPTSYKTLNSPDTDGAEDEDEIQSTDEDKDEEEVTSPPTKAHAQGRFASKKRRRSFASPISTTMDESVADTDIATNTIIRPDDKPMRHNTARHVTLTKVDDPSDVHQFNSIVTAMDFLGVPYGSKARIMNSVQPVKGYMVVYTNGGPIAWEKENTSSSKLAGVAKAGKQRVDAQASSSKRTASAPAGDDLTTQSSVHPPAKRSVGRPPWKQPKKSTVTPPVVQVPVQKRRGRPPWKHGQSSGRSPTSDLAQPSPPTAQQAPARRKVGRPPWKHRNKYALKSGVHAPSSGEEDPYCSCPDKNPIFLICDKCDAEFPLCCLGLNRVPTVAEWFCKSCVKVTCNRWQPHLQNHSF